MFCQKCGEPNDSNNYRCTRCGFELHGPPTQVLVAEADNTLGGLIPYKNPRALWAYYLGIFSIIPALGIPLGVAAVVLGLQGLRFARVHPETKGKVHAWIGVIVGGLSALVQLVLILVLAVAALSK